jgi:hypothetical protein
MLATEFKSVMFPESPVLREPLIRRFQNDLLDGLVDHVRYPVYRLIPVARVLPFESLGLR